MLETLTKRLTSVFDKIRKKGILRAEDIETSLREVRLALLEADVALPVVKSFVESVKNKAAGQEIVRLIQPEQMVVKIVHDELVSLLGGYPAELQFSGKTPFSYLIVGLQGAGKTTTTAKLAFYLHSKCRKRPLLVSLDVYRPAAREQLKILGDQIGVHVFSSEASDPMVITDEALRYAGKNSIDVILFDTAGRLHIDENLIQEAQAIQKKTNPLEVLLVADALMGQDALNVAKAFNEALGLTGIILTRADGDGRGGAILSMRAVTQCPIKFLGVGEKTTQLEPFVAERIARRILDMGDVVSLVERAMETAEQENAETLAKRFQKGQFSLEDMSSHLQQMLKMGGIMGMMGFLPGFSRIKEQIESSGNLNDRLIHRQIAIIQSMTLGERKDPKVLNASRRRRIALGCGQTVADVNRLLKQFEQMRTVMKKMKNNQGFMRGGLKQLFGR